MKHTKITSVVAALAFTAILGATSSAHAQAVNGDLILGFEATGSTNVYEVDLGSASQFIGVTQPLHFSLSTADLSGTTFGYGASWSTNNAVQFGFIGATASSSDIAGTPAETLFTSYNTFSAAPLRSTSGAQQSGTQASVLSLYNDFNLSAITPGNTAALQTGSDQTSDPDSFSYKVANDPNFGFGAGFASSQLDFKSNGTTSALDVAKLNLYELTPTTSAGQAGALLGQFTLADSGVLTFAAVQAAPEPSAYALGLTAVVLFFVLRRRQSIGQA